MTVTDAIRESMSAVMDGEGSELDIARVLREVEANPEARAYWEHLQQSRSLLRTGQLPPDIDVSAAVRDALANPSPESRRVGPLGSLAVAASVTFAVVFGGQGLLGQAPLAPAEAPMVTTVPGGVVPIPGAAAVQARFGINNPQKPVLQRREATTFGQSTAEIYDQLARERFVRYAGEHARATALLQPNTFVPYARASDEPKTQ